jgi:translation initiation factor IF-2
MWCPASGRGHRNLRPFGPAHRSQTFGPRETGSRSLRSATARAGAALRASWERTQGGTPVAASPHPRPGPGPAGRHGGRVGARRLGAALGAAVRDRGRGASRARGAEGARGGPDPHRARRARRAGPLGGGQHGRPTQRREPAALAGRPGGAGRPAGHAPSRPEPLSGRPLIAPGRGLPALARHLRRDAADGCGASRAACRMGRGCRRCSAPSAVGTGDG